MTEISDRESDISENWAYLPEPGFHILTRANKDRSIKEGGGNLSTEPLQPGGAASVKLYQRPYALTCHPYRAIARPIRGDSPDPFVFYTPSP